MEIEITDWSLCDTCVLPTNHNCSDGMLHELCPILDELIKDSELMDESEPDWADDVIDWEPCSGCVAYDDGMDCEKVKGEDNCPINKALNDAEDEVE